MTKETEVMVGRTDWRYARTTVTRSVFDRKSDGGPWVVIEEFQDALVRPAGDDNYTRGQSAMIRAYSPDVEFYGDEDYRNGNGITVVIDEKLVKHYGEDYRGLVIDCDGDLALRRILGTVISHTPYGGGEEEWVMLVNREPDCDRGDEKFQWEGWGWSNEYRIERWVVGFPDDDEASD